MKKILLVWLGLFVTLCAFESAVIVVVKISGAGRGALQPRGYARNPFNQARAGLIGTRSNGILSRFRGLAIFPACHAGPGCPSRFIIQNCSPIAPQFASPRFQMKRPAGLTQRACHATQRSLLLPTWTQHSTASGYPQESLGADPPIGDLMPGFPATGLKTVRTFALQPVFKI